MMFAILFALLGLFLVGFREGVWRKYTPEDVARWKAEAAAPIEFAAVAHLMPTAGPVKQHAPAASSVPQPAALQPVPTRKEDARKESVARELEIA